MTAPKRITPHRKPFLTETLTLRLRPETAKRLKARAKTERLSRSDVARHLITEGLDHLEKA